ncbi:AB hydrolase superfamily protein YfhM-like isoform X2 [Solanum tuberosum]|uniref:AB hydrolase superfamily protein YfhM-like isoform X2 n=1 Tax=Solanum tuberosum TaxID=4113 RepID=UPI000739F873|nr:PREDICTED: AB hydrolase superfamily protein YfhM-like isoform X2 [Solanum tuberosum]
MEEIDHKFVEVNGLKLHIAEIGSGFSPVVVFLHGFPEIWYSWRYQMIAVGKAGYRAIAPDFRGYGLSDQPTQPEKTTLLDLVSDLLALLDALSISKEPGRAEADFGRLDAKTVVRNVYILFSRSEIPIANEDQEIMDIVQPSTPLPPWFSEEDLAAYGALYEKSGFRTALQVTYRRSMHEQANIKDPRIHVPALFITGEKDYFLKFPGVQDYISGGLKSLVPNLQMVNLPEGTHFVQEQLPDEVNRLVLDFLTKNSQS